MILDDLLGSGSLCISFIKSNFFQVRNEFGDIIFRTLSSDWVEREFVLNSNFDYLKFTNESHLEKVNCLIWQPKSIKSDIVVFLSNMPDGWPTLLNVYFSKYNHDIISIVLSADTQKFPLYRFEFKNGAKQRIIQSIKDSDKWEFFQSGLVLPFEKTENYKSRKVSDRLNNDIIKGYLLENGISLEVSDFWLSNGNAVEYTH